MARSNALSSNPASDPYNNILNQQYGNAMSSIEQANSLVSQRQIAEQQQQLAQQQATNQQPYYDYRNQTLIPAMSNYLQNTYAPYMSQLGTYMSDLLTKGSSLTPEVEQAQWNRTREQIAQPYAQARQTAGETAAGLGSMRSGAYQQQLGTIDLAQAKAMRDAAIDQTIANYQQRMAEEQYRTQAGLSYAGIPYMGGGV